jgi:hypothetical protein
LLVAFRRKICPRAQLAIVDHLRQRGAYLLRGAQYMV